MKRTGVVIVVVDFREKSYITVLRMFISFAKLKFSEFEENYEL